MLDRKAGFYSGDRPDPEDGFEPGERDYHEMARIFQMWDEEAETPE